MGIGLVNLAVSSARKRRKGKQDRERVYEEQVETCAAMKRADRIAKEDREEPLSTFGMHDMVRGQLRRWAGCHQRDQLQLAVTRRANRPLKVTTKTAILAMTFSGCPFY